jgi:hypothetical protein
MLDHDRGGLWVGQQPLKLRPLSIQPDANLGDDFGDLQPFPGRPSGHTGDLPIQIGTLIMRRHPCVDHRAAGQAVRKLDDDRA